MLEMRPCCECCGVDLLPGCESALICSFECTFCDSCNQSVLHGTCPNCGDRLVRRPARSEKWLAKNPASTARIVKELGCAALD
jgi:hypothetical protein